MLKFIFWSLLCINGLLFAYGQGYLGNFKGNEREPARMKSQLRPEAIKLVTADEASAAAAPKVPAKVEPAAIACTEIGNFLPGDGKRFEAQLAALDLGERQSRRNVAVQEITNHIVYIAPQGSKEAAERKANELKQMGVSNYFIMSDNSALKWGISLGVFKSEAAAKSLLAALNKQGVHSARIDGRGPTTNRLAYRFREIDADTKARLAEIKARFPQADIRSCK